MGASRAGSGRMKADGAYFSERARQERAAAMRAANLEAREAHLELAKRYDALVEASAAPEIAA
jgi:crotonobetainyl-CoA:carnitine CoA-transferase CaiB-like acyl-CoA transferase